MDILVTTPKSEIKNSKREAADVERHGGHYFRTFKMLPKVDIGDRIYFVEDGEITGYGIIFKIKHESITCDTTGRTWTGHHVCYNGWTWLKATVKYPGFRGYRYISNLPPIFRKWLYLGENDLNGELSN